MFVYACMCILYSMLYLQIKDLKEKVSIHCKFLRPLVEHLCHDKGDSDLFPVAPQPISRFILQLTRPSSAVGGLTFFPEKAAALLLQLLRTGCSHGFSRYKKLRFRSYSCGARRGEAVLSCLTSLTQCVRRR